MKITVLKISKLRSNSILENDAAGWHEWRLVSPEDAIILLKTQSFSSQLLLVHSFRGLV